MGAETLVAVGAMQIASGIMGYQSAQEEQAAARGRAGLLRAEAEAEAARYGESAQRFKAKQKLAFLKSGVEITGSPLDILDETSRIASENISAIRARGEMGAVSSEMAGEAAMSRGRGALLGSFAGAGMSFAGAYRAANPPANPNPVANTGQGFSGRP